MKIYLSSINKSKIVSYSYVVKIGFVGNINFYDKKIFTMNNLLTEEDSVFKSLRHKTIMMVSHIYPGFLFEEYFPMARISCQLTL